VPLQLPRHINFGHQGNVSLGLYGHFQTPRCTTMVQNILSSISNLIQKHFGAMELSHLPGLPFTIRNNRPITNGVKPRRHSILSPAYKATPKHSRLCPDPVRLPQCHRRQCQPCRSLLCSSKLQSFRRCFREFHWQHDRSRNSSHTTTGSLRGQGKLRSLDTAGIPSLQ
jgi:hypothetical protein